MLIHKPLDFILFQPRDTYQLRPGCARRSISYFVYRGKINAVFDGISLELPIVVDDDLAVGVVDGDRLVIAISGLAICLFRQTSEIQRLKYPSFIFSEICCYKTFSFRVIVDYRE